MRGLCKANGDTDAPALFYRPLGYVKMLVNASAQDTAEELLHAFKMVVPRVAIFLPSIIGPTLVWQCKANLLNIYCNANSNCCLLHVIGM
jgi:hypothetical protein